jgi:hypothetical protein
VVKISVLYWVFALVGWSFMKHLIADYFLQGKYMLGKFKPGWEFLGPLTAHCLVHFVFTFVTATVFLVANDHGNDVCLATAVSAFDFICHFIMDRIKAGPKYLGRYKDMMKPSFWRCLGIDQAWHHYTDLAIVAALVFKVLV